VANCTDPTYALPQYPRRYDVLTVTPYIQGRSGGKQPNMDNFVKGALQYNRLAYCKSSPGDCGSPNSQDVNPYQIAGQSESVAGAGFAVAGGIGGAGSAAAGIASTASVVLAPVGVIIGVLGAISAHHKQAVITEQATLCQVANAWNQVMDNLEPAVAAGKVSLQQAIQYVQNAHDSLVGMIQSIEKSCNAACFFHAGLDSLLSFNKKYVLPSLVPNQTTVVAPQGAAGSSASPTVPGAAVAPSGSTTYIAIAGLVGAKLAGVY
jgi:hypothetical protein